nr:hypothetical protein [Tanacetum cinerariifolium]
MVGACCVQTRGHWFKSRQWQSQGACWLLGSSGKDDGSGVRGSGVEQEAGKRCKRVGREKRFVPGCLFVVGLSGGGSGIGMRVGEWKENGESRVVESWREKLVGMNNGPFKMGGKRCTVIVLGVLQS